MAITEATVGLIAAAEGEAVRRRALRLAWPAAIAATDDALELEAAGIELIDKQDPRPLALQARVRAAVRAARGRPRGAAVRLLLRRLRGRGARQGRAPAGRLEAPRPRLPHAGRGDRRRAGRADQGAQGRARAADGRQPRRAPPGRVRRGHRGRARAAQRLRHPLPEVLDRHGLEAGLLRPLLGRLPARPPVRRPQRSRRGRDDGGRRRGDRRPGGGVRRRELQRARRRPRAQRLQPARVRRRPLRGVPQGQGALRPRRPPEPGRDGRRRADHGRHPRRRAAAGAAAADAPLVRRARRHARRGRPLPAHRRLPQDRQRRDVPVLHGHARGGARHPRARQRARQGALAARPAQGAGRRAPARDPRPLPRVQGVQERVPAERRHGLDEVRVPLALPGPARRAAALAAVRSNIRRLNRLGAATAPLSNLPAGVPALRRLLERTAGIAHQRPLPRFARESLVRWERRRDARGARGAARRRRLPGRLVHHLHRAGDRPRGDRAAGGRRLPGAAGERRLLRALEHLQGPARPGARDGRGAWSRGWRRRPSAASRSSAASPPAC